MTYVYFWIKESGSPPIAGGFLRCDTKDELDAFIEQCKERDIAFKQEI